MEKKPLYTIGHGARKEEEFLALLQQYDISFLVDVRSSPYSKFNPHFNQINLEHLLEEHNIKYVFMGDSLGGRPNDDNCYNEERLVDYEIVKTKDFFKKGIERLKTAYNKDLNVAIMCSESKPSECHRTKLIGRVLSAANIILQHIDEKGKVKDQYTVILEMNNGLGEVDLFGNYINETSRKSYNK